MKPLTAEQLQNFLCGTGNAACLRTWRPDRPRSASTICGHSQLVLQDVKTVSGMLSHFSAGFTLDAYVQCQAVTAIESIHSGAF